MLIFRRLPCLFFWSNYQFQKSEEEIKYFSVKKFFIKILNQKIPLSKEKMLENISPVKKMDYYIHSNTLILEELISEGHISHVTENWYKPSHVLLHLVSCSSRRVSHPAGNNCSWITSLLNWFHLTALAIFKTEVLRSIMQI